MSVPGRLVFETLDALAREALHHLHRAATSALLARGRFDLALSGGSTPRRLYELMADAPPSRYAGWHFWWGDERFVGHEHGDSNYRAAREAFFDAVSIPGERIHPVPTDASSPEEAAARYGEEMREHMGGAPFGLILLGMGADGHTASLFPGISALEERDVPVTVARPETAPHARVTLTYPTLEAADRILFLVAGADKAETVAQLFGTPPAESPFPAARARSERGTTTWFLDRAAASALS